MTKTEIRDELVRIRTDLILYKRDQAKCAELEEELIRLRKELAAIVLEEQQQKSDSELNKIERGIK